MKYTPDQIAAALLEDELDEGMGRRDFLKRLGLSSMFAKYLKPKDLLKLGPAAAPAAPPPPAGWTGAWTERMQQTYHQIRERFIDERMRGWVDSTGARRKALTPDQAMQRWEENKHRFRQIIHMDPEMHEKFSLRNSPEYKPGPDEVEQEKWDREGEQADREMQQAEQRERQQRQQQQNQRQQRRQQRRQQPPRQPQPGGRWSFSAGGLRRPGPQAHEWAENDEVAEALKKLPVPPSQ